MDGFYFFEKMHIKYAKIGTLNFSVWDLQL